MDPKNAIKYSGNELKAIAEKTKRLYYTKIEQLINDDKIFGPVRLVTEGDHLAFEGLGFYTRFRSGDKVDLTLASSENKLIRTGDELTINSVIYPEPGKIRISFTKRSGSISENQDFFIAPTSNVSMQQNVNKAVYRAANDIAMQAAYERGLSLKDVKFNLQSEQMRNLNLNKDQLATLEAVLSQNLRGCIQGPPGTGKTQTLCGLVELLVSAGLKVGLASFTHNAIDNALMRIAKNIPTKRLVRIVSTIKSPSYLARFENLGIAVKPGFNKNIQTKDFDLIAATAHSWILSREAPHVDVLLIDEASQLPSFFLVALKMKCQSIIALGDHKQLPPTLTSNLIPENERDLFSIMFSEQAKILRLETQYRMNTEIQEWSSKNYYESKLIPHDSVRMRDIVRGRPGHLSQSSSVQFYNAKDENEAATKTADLVKKLLSTSGITAKQIGIIGAHRTELSKVTQQVQAQIGLNVLSELKIDTVERFQGQEREVMILNLGNSLKNASDSPNENFINNPKRINVAVTRTKSRFYCLSSFNPVDARHETEMVKFVKWTADQSRGQYFNKPNDFDNLKTGFKIAT